MGGMTSSTSGRGETRGWKERESLNHPWRGGTQQAVTAVFFVQGRKFYCVKPHMGFVCVCTRVYVWGSICYSSWCRVP